VTERALPAIETSLGWKKLTEVERLALVDLLDRLAGFSSTDRATTGRTLGMLPKAIEKAVWDAIAVRDPEAPIITDRNGQPEPDPSLRSNENVPLPGPIRAIAPDSVGRLASAPYESAVDAYMAAEVLPYVPDAWVDRTKTKLGYEVPLTRHFYRYVPPRPLGEIDAEIKALEDEIQRLLGEVTA